MTAAKRRRRECPRCGRLTAYSLPHRGSPDRFLASLRHFVHHNDPATGRPCAQGDNH